MAKKQTRKSISVSGKLYYALQEYAVMNKLTVSGLVEKTMRDKISFVDEEPPKKNEVDSFSREGNVFTF